ncbi:MAG: ATP-binding protein [Vicinamibacterales bacterium]
MASGKLLRQLIKYGARGDVTSFRAAAEAAISEEREKQHHLLANDLERMLYADHMSLDSRLRELHPATELPRAKDGELPLLEERPVVREEHDIVLDVATSLALQGIIREHQRADVLRSHGLQPARKLLFVGPPGCGKTLAAEVIASALSMPLVLVRLDSLVSSFLGETASNLRRVFDFVSKTPVVALFDEVDALTKDRGDSADHGELKRAVNAVLQMMDSYRGSSILVATTNYESILDRAVWRRFDEVLRFDKPDEPQIGQVLALKLAGVRRNFELDDDAVRSQCVGLSHADIERVLRRAVKDMVLAGDEFLEVRHIKAARAREQGVVR